MMANYDALINRSAKRNGVPPALLKGLIKQESGFNPNAGSPAGAQGLTQLMPGTARGLGVTDLHDPAQSIEGGAKYLGQQLRAFHGNVAKALAAYNAGPGAVQKYGGVPPYAETQNYVKVVQANAKAFGGGAATPDSPDAPATAMPAKSGGVGKVIKGRPVSYLPAKTTVDDSAALTDALLNGSGKGSLLKRYQAAVSTGNYTTTTPAQIDPGTPASYAAPKGTPMTAAPAGKAQGSLPAGKSRLLEEFYNGPGGVNVKDGKRVPTGFVSGHKDHVHVAAGRKTIVEVGKLAQQMGLHVGENPSFGGVAPVHVKNSYHYKGEAIDVSGDAKKMAAFSRRVAREFRV